MPVSPERIRVLNTSPPHPAPAYVLYWAQMNRRATSNHALSHAAEIANANNLPLLVYEGLTFTYKAANDRIHTFVLEGVPEMAAGIRAIGAGYFFYLRARPEDPNDILYRLAARAHSLITDDYPTFIAAQHNATVPARIGIPFVVVDASCIVPMNPA